jgi:hypothetical protein
MNTRLLRYLIVGFAVMAILAGCVSAPSQRVSMARHPNLAEAQDFIQNAIDKISAAQGANEYDMNGHAAKAKDLLNQAYAELKLAAEAANAKR